MATYIQGLTDYIPQIQPFSPDYNFYSGVLDFKQGKYDASRQKLSNLYGSLLNAPLTREQNVETRDKFFKTIEQDIKKMGAMDLSLSQNTEAASGILINCLIITISKKIWCGQRTSRRKFNVLQTLKIV